MSLFKKIFSRFQKTTAKVDPKSVVVHKQEKATKREVLSLIDLDYISENPFEFPQLKMVYDKYLSDSGYSYNDIWHSISSYLRVNGLSTKEIRKALFESEIQSTSINERVSGSLSKSVCDRLSEKYGVDFDTNTKYELDSQLKRVRASESIPMSHAIAINTNLTSEELSKIRSDPFTYSNPKKILELFGNEYSGLSSNILFYAVKMLGVNLKQLRMEHYIELMGKMPLTKSDLDDLWDSCVLPEFSMLTHKEKQECKIYSDKFKLRKQLKD